MATAHGWPQTADYMIAGAQAELWHSGLDRADMLEIYAGEYGGANVAVFKQCPPVVGQSV